MTDPAATAPAGHGRIVWIDVARGVALVAMATYHFAWDLEFFGYAEPGMTTHGGWKLYARAIASSFLLLVGVGLWLGHGRGIRWRPFLRRFAMVAGAAALISAATWFAVPDAFIFFGILHEIALASLLGLAFLRLPPAATLVVAAGVIAAPFFLRSPLFDHPALWWVGLSPVNPHSNDYVPVFPWFGAVLAGIGLAAIAARAGVLQRLAAAPPGRWSRPLAFAGRHSLAFYLVHQPVLIGLVWLAAHIVPPEQETAQVRFLAACQRACEESRDTDFCARYCPCMLDAVERDDMLARLMGLGGDAAAQEQVQSFARQCTAGTDALPPTGG